MKLTTYLSIALLGLAACGKTEKEADAYGQFEAQETIISSETTGKLLTFSIEEGDELQEEQVIGVIDAKGLDLQKDQLKASQDALLEKVVDVAPQLAVTDAQIAVTRQQIVAATAQSEILKRQIAVTKQQIENAQIEKRRFQRLVQENAATQKQLDDINGQIAVLERQKAVQEEQLTSQNSQIAVQERQIAVQERQMAAQSEQSATQNRSVLSETNPLAKRIAQLDDQIERTRILNPIAGTVLLKYIQQNEIVTVGKPLYKIADLSTMTLRCYISATQLPAVHLGKSVTVAIDNGAEAYKNFKGQVTWIANRAEFTPKTILTKDERSNLVYAVKIKVRNPNGEIKIGMPAEVRF